MRRASKPQTASGTERMREREQEREGKRERVGRREISEGDRDAVRKKSNWHLGMWPHSAPQESVRNRE